MTTQENGTAEVTSKDSIQIHALFTILQTELDKLKTTLPDFIVAPRPDSFELICDVLTDFEDGIDGLFALVERVVEDVSEHESWAKAEVEAGHKTEPKVGKGRKNKKDEIEKLKEMKKRVQAAEKEAKAAKKAAEKLKKAAEKSEKKSVSKSKSPSASASASSSSSDEAPKKRRKSRAGKADEANPSLSISEEGDVVPLNL